jgi:hypothetical protein
MIYYATCPICAGKKTIFMDIYEEDGVKEEFPCWCCGGAGTVERAKSSDDYDYAADDMAYDVEKGN